MFFFKSLCLYEKPISLSIPVQEAIQVIISLVIEKKKKE